MDQDKTNRMAKGGRKRKGSVGRPHSFSQSGRMPDDPPADKPEYSPRLKCGRCGHVFVPVFQRTWPNGKKDCYCKSCGTRHSHQAEHFEALARKSRQERRPAHI